MLKRFLVGLAVVALSLSGWGLGEMWFPQSEPAPPPVEAITVTPCGGPSAQLVIFGGETAAQQFQDWYSEWATGIVCNYFEQGDYRTATHRVFVYYTGGGLD